MEASNEKNKRIAKNTVFMYIRMLLVMVVSLYTVRVVLNSLGVEDYGIYSAVGGVVLTFTIISNTIAGASQRFFAIKIGKGDFAGLKKIFSVILASFISISLLLLVIGETIGVWFVHSKMTIPVERIDAADWVFQTSTVIFVVTLLANPFQALIIAREKMNIYAYVSIVEVFLKLIIAFMISSVECDKLKLYAALMCISSIVVNSLYVFYSKRNFKEATFLISFDKYLLKDVFSYTSWSFFGCIALICNSQGLNILLNLFFGPIANTAYSVGNQVKGAVRQFSNNLYVSIKPVIIKSYAAKESEYLNRLFSFSTKAIFALLYTLILPIVLTIPFILKIWIGTVSDYMVDFTRLLLIYSLILSISDPITTVVQASGKVKPYHLYVDGFSILSLPLAFIALKLGASANSVFLIAILVLIVAHYFRLVLLKKILGISIGSYLRNIIVPILVSVGITSAIAYSISSSIDMNSVLNFIIVGLISVFSVILCSYFVILNKNDRKTISVLVNKIIHKK